VGVLKTLFWHFDIAYDITIDRALSLALENFPINVSIAPRTNGLHKKHIQQQQKTTPNSPISSGGSLARLAARLNHAIRFRSRVIITHGQRGTHTIHPARSRSSITP
jgi:hypothetical protein